MLELGSIVHRRPLASIAGEGDSYSLGYSVPSGCSGRLGCLTADVPCSQSTYKLSKTVLHLAVKFACYRPQMVAVGRRCGQEWWSGFGFGSESAVKTSLTVARDGCRPREATFCRIEHLPC
jgi:hypothetical protein